MKTVIFIIVSVVGLILVLTCTTCVPAGHRGVVTYFGSVSPNILGEGLHTVPFWSVVHDRPIQQGKMDGTAECFSSDMQQVKVSFVALYRQPENKVAELYQLYQGSPYESLIEPRIQECLKQVTAKYPAQELTRKRELVREEVLASVRAAIGELMIVNDINLVNIDLTDELEKAIELKMVMEQQAQAKNFELDKERKDAEIRIVRAKAEAESVKLTGEALAKAPQMIELEIVKKWNGVSPSTIVVDKGGASILLPAKQN